MGCQFEDVASVVNWWLCGLFYYQIMSKPNTGKWKCLGCGYEKTDKLMQTLGCWICPHCNKSEMLPPTFFGSENIESKDEIIKEMLYIMLRAIERGEWVVDGACDPDQIIERAKLELGDDWEKDYALPI